MSMNSFLVLVLFFFFVLNLILTSLAFCKSQKVHFILSFLISKMKVFEINQGVWQRNVLTTLR